MCTFQSSLLVQSLLSEYDDRNETSRGARSRYNMKIHGTGPLSNGLTAHPPGSMEALRYCLIHIRLILQFLRRNF